MAENWDILEMRGMGVTGVTGVTGFFWKREIKDGKSKGPPLWPN